jgi:uncharacterized protein involved in exopolysaccharide biosynthesis
MGINSDIDFLEYSKTLSQRWWIIVIFALIGGSLGFLFSNSNPPIYEAHSVLMVGNDYSSIDPSIWTDTKSDSVVNKTSLIVNSKEIQNQIIADFKAKGIIVSSDAFSIAKRISKWDLVVQHTDPKVAAEVADAWLDMSFTTLEEARQHSINALAITEKLNILTNCSKEITPSTFCAGITNNVQLSTEIADLTKALDIEEKESMSISVVITFDKGSTAEIPTQPTVNNRNLLVLIGSLLGLIVGSMGVIFGRDIREWRKK